MGRRKSLPTQGPLAFLALGRDAQGFLGGQIIEERGDEGAQGDPMFLDRQRLGNEHAVVVLELLVEASQGDGLPTADHAAQGNHVAFQNGALDVDHELPVMLGFIVPGLVERLREPLMLHDVNPHGLLLTVSCESGPGSAGGQGDASVCPLRPGR